MKTTTKTIIAVSVAMSALFYYLALLAYPRVCSWMIAGVKDISVNILTEVPDSYAIIAALSMAAAALVIGLGTYLASRTRTAKKTITVFFVLFDLAILASFVWLAMLKYWLIKITTDLAGLADGISYPLTNVRLYQIGLFAIAVVAAVTWIYIKIQVPEREPLNEVGKPTSSELE